VKVENGAVADRPVVSLPADATNCSAEGMDKSNLMGFPFFTSFAPSGYDGSGLPVTDFS
jgi:hypothetical protein